MFKDFGRRLQRDVNKLINNRIKISSELAGNAIKAEPMKVDVSYRYNCNRSDTISISKTSFKTSSDRLKPVLRLFLMQCKDMQSGLVVH